MSNIIGVCRVIGEKVMKEICGSFLCIFGIGNASFRCFHLRIHF